MNPAEMTDELYARKKRSISDREQAMNETLALIDAMQERKRTQAIQDEGLAQNKEDRAWNQEQQGRTRLGWDREDREIEHSEKLRPVADAMTVASAVKSLLPGTDPSEYSRLRGFLQESGLDVSALPESFKDTKSMLEYVYPEQTYEHRQRMGEIREQNAGRYSGGRSATPRTMVSLIDGKPMYVQFNSSTGEWENTGMEAPSKGTGRDYSITDRVNLDNAARENYKLLYQDVAGGIKEGAPTFEEYRNEYANQMMGGTVESQAPAASFNGYENTPKTKIPDLLQQYSEAPEEEQAAFKQYLKNAGPKGEQVLRWLNDEARNGTGKTKVASSSSKTDPLGRDYENPGAAKVRSVINGGTRGTRFINTPVAQESTRTR